MERSEVFNKFSEICKDVFEDEELVITEKTTAADVKGWESLTHLALVNELMLEFGVKLTLDEINKSKNIGELMDAVIRHIR